MDLSAAVDWEPPSDWERIVVVDSHAAGEPFRVVVSGQPVIEGATMVERRRFARERHDRLRRALMWEPRGHADMYGAFVGPPVEAESDLSVLFLHNEGFSTMCGHGIIALTTVVLETGILEATEPLTVVRIDSPAGRIVATAEVSDGRVGTIRFRNVPSFVLDLDQSVEVPGMGSVRYDLAFGGAFYAFVSASDLGLGLDPGSSAALIDAGRKVKSAVSGAREVTHPVEDDLGFLYGVIFAGAAEQPGHHSRNVCVFAEGEVDRSPTGTGASARLAIHHARGEIGVDEEIVVESILGSTFSGRIVEETMYGGIPAVVPEVGGSAYITGRAEMWLDPRDPLVDGFLIR